MVKLYDSFIVNFGIISVYFIAELPEESHLSKKQGLFQFICKQRLHFIFPGTQTQKITQNIVLIKTLFSQCLRYILSYFLHLKLTHFYYCIFYH